MIKIFQYCSLILLYMGALASVGAQPKDLKAIEALVRRVVPNHAEQFKLSIQPGGSGRDHFEIAGSNDGLIQLSGNNQIAIASALNWYLKYFCHVQMGWNGSQMHLPAKLPIPDRTVTKEVEPQWRVYMNYCTFNYSASWWNWERWEKEIDFMAMNGINMPLSVVGLEGVWYNALLRVGYSDHEARAFLVGPAYSAWQWMTNIESANGPLPKSWIDNHIILGKKIMQRELELGMQPIQQGFSGFVPRSFVERYPKAKIAYGKDWCSFKATAQLDPLDPLFDEFGKIFLEEQDKLFGSHGYYAADPFHEGTPPSEDRAYLHAVGQAIQKLVSTYDTKGHTVMQAWSLRKDIVEAIPKDRLLILDLNGSKYKDKALDGFWGYNFVVGNLHNFGGRINLHGDVRLLASNQFGQASSKYPNAIGSGLFMEAIGQNPLFYDLAFEMPFHREAIDADDWVRSYLFRRYNTQNTNISAVGAMLLAGPYRPGTNGVENSSIIAARPALNVKKSGPNAGFKIPYAADTLAMAWKLLLDASYELQGSDGYRFDVMDIGRQVLSNLGQEMHKHAAEAFIKGDKKGFKLHSQRFLTLLKDVDKLLGTRSDFNFNTWIKDAQSQATNAEEKKLYTFNASQLVTWWGGDKEPSIFDYAWREWNGLIGDYYYERWSRFYAMLERKLNTGESYSEEGLKQVYGRESLRANTFYTDLASWEESWIKSPKSPKKVNAGREIKVAKHILAQYEPLLKEYY